MLSLQIGDISKMNLLFMGKFTKKLTFYHEKGGFSHERFQNFSADHCCDAPSFAGSHPGQHLGLKTPHFSS
jgi:hypothetical protein